jgi:hypothetical protein
MNIDEFTSEINYRNGLLRGNRFKINITPPFILSDLRDISRSLSFWCQGIAAPGYQLLTHDVKRHTYGPTEKRPFAPNFQQLQLTFMSDGNTDCWEFFNQWMQNIIPHDAGNGINSQSNYTSNLVYLVEYKEAYAVDMEIVLFDETGDIIRKFFVREAFPSNMNPIQLDWANQNNYANFSVFMEFLDWSTSWKGDVQPAAPPRNTILPEPTG